MSLNLATLIFLYYACYAAFSGLTKSLHGSAVAVLPTSLLAASACWAAHAWLTGQRRHLRLDGPALSAGLGGALILVSSTVAYSLRGVSLVLPLLLMKGGVLLLAPTVDAAAGARPSPRSLAVLCLAGTAVLLGVWHRVALDGTAAAMACAVAYLAGYALKLRAVGQRRGDWSFFVTETTVTLAVALPASLVWCAARGVWPTTDPAALLAGAASQGCGAFGGLLLLRGAVAGRAATHSALVPINRCASLLAGLTASACLGQWPATGEWVGAALMCAALWVGVR